MGAKEREQMCLECNGRIPLEALSCPYCGAHFSHLTEELPMSKPTNSQDSVNSLYPPPYRGATSASAGEEKKSPLFVKPQEAKIEKKFAQPAPSSLGLPSTPETKTQEDSGYFWPLLLLSLAANLFLIGFLQLCFSEGDHLTLQWNSKYWFVYCLLAIPCCLMSFKKMKAFK